MLPEAFLLRLSRNTCRELDELLDAKPRLKHIDRYIDKALPCGERVKAVLRAARAADIALHDI